MFNTDETISFDQDSASTGKEKNMLCLRQLHTFLKSWARIRERKAASITGLNFWKSISCTQHKKGWPLQGWNKHVRTRLQWIHSKNNLCKCNKKHPEWIQSQRELERGKRSKQLHKSRNRNMAVSSDTEHTHQPQSFDFETMQIDNRSHSCGLSTKLTNLFCIPWKLQMQFSQKKYSNPFKGSPPARSKDWQFCPPGP